MSEKSSMDMAIDGFKHIAEKHVKQGLSLTDSMAALQEISSGFKNDEIFQSMYPSVYGIAECERALSERALSERALNERALNEQQK